MPRATTPRPCGEGGRDVVRLWGRGSPWTRGRVPAVPARYGTYSERTRSCSPILSTAAAPSPEGKSHSASAWNPPEAASVGSGDGAGMAANGAALSGFSRLGRIPIPRRAARSARSPGPRPWAPPAGREGTELGPAPAAPVAEGQRGPDPQPRTPPCPHRAEGRGLPSQGSVSVPSPAQRLRAGRGTRSPGTGLISPESPSRKRPRPRDGPQGAAAAAGGEPRGRAAHGPVRSRAQRSAPPPPAPVPGSLGRWGARSSEPPAPSGAVRPCFPSARDTARGLLARGEARPEPRATRARTPRCYPPGLTRLPAAHGRRHRAGLLRAGRAPGIPAFGRGARSGAKRRGRALPEHLRLRRFLWLARRSAAGFSFSLSAAPPCAGVPSAAAGTPLPHGAAAGEAKTAPAAPGAALCPRPRRCAHILPPVALL